MIFPLGLDEEPAEQADEHGGHDGGAVDACMCDRTDPGLPPVM
jgi:hypothetical protein